MRVYNTIDHPIQPSVVVMKAVMHKLKTIYPSTYKLLMIRIRAMVKNQFLVVVFRIWDDASRMVAFDLLMICFSSQGAYVCINKRLTKRLNTEAT